MKNLIVQGQKKQQRSLYEHTQQLLENFSQIQIQQQTDDDDKDNSNIIFCESPNTNVNETQTFKIITEKYTSDQEDALVLIFEDQSEKSRINKMKQLCMLKDQILENVTHDLKSPINGILTYSEILSQMLKQSNNQQIQKSNISLQKQPYIQQKQQYQQEQEKISEETPEGCIQIIQNIANTLFLLVKDIQDYSLIKNKAFSVHPTDINLLSLISEVIMFNKQQIQSKNLETKINIPDNISIQTDPLRLKQILMNLLSNAVKYTQKGYIEILVENPQMVTDINQNNLLIFTIKDTGIGIPQEFQANIFERFQTLDQNTKSYGVGLGLNIVKKLVNQLGPKQEIQIISKDGQGSLFQFQIYKNLQQKNPNGIKCISSKNILKYSQNRRGTITFSMEDIIEFRKNSKGNIQVKQYNDQHNKIPKDKEIKNILIVDDEEFNISALKFCVQKIVKSQIYWVRNGKEAVEFIQKNSNNQYLIFMDMHMPIMNGFEATTQIKTISPRQKIILCSSEIFTQNQHKQVIDLFDGILQKPINHNELRQILIKQ